jgi:hypothetical protein
LYIDRYRGGLSITDELMKLANLREKGIVSEDEFHQMKQDLIRKNMISRALMILIIIIIGSFLVYSFSRK